MFDIGFSELLVIGVVALIVIGPERLPGVARTLGHLFGRMQRYVNDVKSDIAREMELDELKKLQQTMDEAARSFEHSVKSEVRATQTEFEKIGHEAGAALSTVAAEPPPPDAQTLSEPPPQTENTEQLELELRPTAASEKRA